MDGSRGRAKIGRPNQRNRRLEKDQEDGVMGRALAKGPSFLAALELGLGKDYKQALRVPDEP